MKYHSVLNSSPTLSFREALFAGLAPDGALLVPETTPRLLSDAGRSTSLHQIGLDVLSLFVDEIPNQKLLSILRNAWNFPIPLVKLDEGIFLLELFHGPSLAFKDIGVRFMAHVISHFLEHHHQELTVLVATSGNTGSAVARGFYNVPNISVAIFFPSEKISRLQELQMTTLGGNITAIEVEGTFDDCQRLVKRALADPVVQRHRTLTTANSINVGRLLPQIAYYGWSIAQLQRQFGVSESPLVVVPSGNFGNITAGVYAKWMGMPLRGFIAATNANDGVIHYLHTGEFVPADTIRTISNAMDVANPGNLARLQCLYKHDVRLLRNDIDAVSISDEETIAEIRRTYETRSTILDPHSAVGVAAARKAQQWMTNAPPIIVTAPAHPAKCADIVQEAIGTTIPLPSTLQESMNRPTHTITMPARYSEVRRLLIS
ncbi:MAG: threonine synthase [Ignavibacteriae bacterium]|nr:threonine synthase [Ignavibacteriota bacterium]